MQTLAEFGHCDERTRRPGTFSWPARKIGSRAKRLLTLPVSWGKVLAVLSNTIYLTSRDGEIFWLSREDLPMHARCIQSRFQSESICVGQSFWGQASALKVGGKVTIDLHGATEWKPSVVLPWQAGSLSEVAFCARRLLRTTCGLGKKKGLAQALPLILAAVDGSEPPTFVNDPLLSRAWSLILDLAMACSSRNMGRAAHLGRDLVGLGPGLTPSGDDFLGGLLFTAHSLKVAYPEEFHWEQETITGLIDWARTQTHSISHTVLRDLALGQGPEPLHEVVVSLLERRGLHRTMGSVEQLIGVGETSGWEILTGMLTGMLLVVGKVSEGESKAISYGSVAFHKT